MALDVQTIAAVADYVPYERPPDNVALWTAIPRGLLSFIVAAQLLDAKAINDDQLLNITATLPPNFAYVMQDCTLTLVATGMGFWDPFCNLNLQNYYRCNRNLAIGLASNWVSGFEVSQLFNGARTLTKNGVSGTPWPRMPILPTPGTTGIQTVMSCGNGDNGATTAGLVDYAISFWQYDLEQIRKFPINTAIHTI